MTDFESIFKEWLDEHELPFPIDEYGEPQDTENLEILKVSQRGVDFICGGDWQTPIWFLLKSDKTLEIVQENVICGTNSHYELEKFLSVLES